MARHRRHVQPADLPGFSQTPLTRRTVIAGAGAAIAAVGTRGLFGPLSTAAAETIDKPWKHTMDPRGDDIALTAGKQTEARFGFMFKDPPSYGPPDELLQQLAAQMGEPIDAGLENPAILSGETFLGQFIDHDMTFDRTPMPDQELDPKGLVNFDSPFFDLASVYGRGPDLDPQFYEADGKHMRIVRTAEGVEDLPRLDDGTALIGDPRNDENLILSQLHLLFLKFHNRCLDTGLAKTLAQAQRLTRWHFQWVIVNDFLKAVVGAELVSQVLQGSPPKPKIDFYKPVDANRPMMPIEYAVAAFRFGHSMVRGRYTLNAAGGVPLFDPSSPDLRGGRPLPAAFEIEWWRFFPMSGAPTSPRNAARLIDTKLAIPLLNLPPTVVKDPMVSLAQRNLIRGKRLGLPAGQDVAKLMKMKPLSASELGLPDPGNPGWAGKAPLWYYILREAEIRQEGRRLGPLGAKLVAEVIVGILSCDKSSYIYDKTPFQPAPPIAPSGQFTMGEFATFAQGA
jgi:Animal haem peroxidase